MTKRRASHVDLAVSYGAVGASNDPSVLRYPPEGSTPYAEEVRLGSGQERFIAASSALMTWGAQRGAGIEVTELVEGAGSEYPGIAFNEAGDPVSAGAVEETQYAPTGERFVTAGTSATLVWAGKREPRRVRVVYVVDEKHRVGFAMGTADESGAVGEELFLVERRPDGSVWATVRGFLTAPSNGLLGIKGKGIIKGAQASSLEQLRALLPLRMVGDVVDAAETPAPEDAAVADPAVADPTLEDSILEAPAVADAAEAAPGQPDAPEDGGR
ncbi:DUF1990 family protein [Leucobacter sp. M11]|uniref:DUF1990 family protein n=1 Tax=Leucobacter sp. M11 TaxID=2993565 RepID=UPI002D7F68AA|nr:DUF1990 family protein [Leucobacter sp. M11]MEB4616657.1 DUF1990 family protein [Leucobacter sp. M11]